MTAPSTQQERKRNRRIGPQSLDATACPDALLTPTTVRTLTGFSNSSIRRLQRREVGPFPAPIAVGGAIRFRAADVTAWLRAQTPRPVA